VRGAHIDGVRGIDDQSARCREAKKKCHQLRSQDDFHSEPPYKTSVSGYPTTDNLHTRTRVSLFLPLSVVLSSLHGQVGFVERLGHDGLFPFK
jgi:hypothetical protein